MRLPSLLLGRRAALQALWLTAAPVLRPLPLLAADPPPSASSAVVTPRGLQFVDFREGGGPTPQYGQLVRFNYVGYTVDGERLRVFDATYDRSEPYFTKHGNGLTCEGLEEALHTMRVGGRRRVVVPPALGFTGDKGPVPPDSGAREKLFKSADAGEPIVFDVELVSIADDLLDRGDYEGIADPAEQVRYFQKLQQGQLSTSSSTT
jgi:hypothetical protein